MTNKDTYVSRRLVNRDGSEIEYTIWWDFSNIVPLYCVSLAGSDDWVLE